MDDSTDGDERDSFNELQLPRRCDSLIDINGNDEDVECFESLSRMQNIWGEGCTGTTLGMSLDDPLSFSPRRRSPRLRTELPSLTRPLDLDSNLIQQQIILQLMARSAQNTYFSQLNNPQPRQVPIRRSEHLRAYMWNGELPPRNYSHPVFSCKIFVGGVPWDVTEDALLDAFSPYGNCKVEWPGNQARFARPLTPRSVPRGKATGYVYMIFEQEHCVKALLNDCSQEFGSAGEWYFKLKARRNNTIETRQVQIIPWVVSDASYVEDPTARLDPKKTVFVGALHGMITAHVLFSIMDELYGKVAFVGIDTDKYKYPIGSGRVAFSSHASYFRAIECAFLEIRTSKFKKKVQIDPFLEESLCMLCQEVPGPFFCRDRSCFRYHCATCWSRRHSPGGGFETHRYLTRSNPRAEEDIRLFRF